MDVAEIFKKSGIRRPVHDLDRIQRMIDHADMIVTARMNGHNDIPAIIPYFRGYEISFTALTIMHSPSKICFYYTGKVIMRH